VRLIEQFAAATAGRVTEVFVSSATMERYGATLDAVLAARDDGAFFCFIDADIVAKGPFIRTFVDTLDYGCAGVTSGKGVWTDDVVVPAGHPGCLASASTLGAATCSEALISRCTGARPCRRRSPVGGLGSAQRVAI
jgi:hypothetical protein